MKYTINRTNHHDFETYELNKRAARAYFIPYSQKSVLERTALKDERYNSDLVEVLSGQWDFSYFAKKSEVPDIFDTETENFDKIQVPSTWQRTGYEPPVYLNCPYEFETPPPNLPDDFSVGVYRKIFKVEDVNNTFYLSFLGVIASLDLYVNGKFVGYSEGAHNTAEFDISSFVVEGENEILALVHKWSSATFVECQDMFRENGIFRDVLLYKLNKTHINDYQIRSTKIDGLWYLTAELELAGDTEACEIVAEIFDGNNLLAKKTIAAGKDVKIQFSDLNAQEWNAEIPKLYDLYFTLVKDSKEIESIRNYTGFKYIEIKNEVFTFNGKNIKLKGVNHHDTHEKNGYVMTFDELERDVVLMK
ncbi:MAG TPA: glycoside hydrolase family 2 TIM barrel-domain containing protein, partial [Clostridiales bacterium]|nr:glycoside hydrolase family 2 TIM barrel-domain containing protein [Clostridiales bacterium]